MQPQKFQQHMFIHVFVAFPDINQYRSSTASHFYYFIHSLTLLPSHWLTDASTHINITENWIDQVHFLLNINNRETACHHLQCKLYYSNKQCKQPLTMHAYKTPKKHKLNTEK